MTLSQEKKHLESTINLINKEILALSKKKSELMIRLNEIKDLLNTKSQL